MKQLFVTIMVTATMGWMLTAWLFSKRSVMEELPVSPFPLSSLGGLMRQEQLHQQRTTVRLACTTDYACQLPGTTCVEGDCIEMMSRSRPPTTKDVKLPNPKDCEVPFRPYQYPQSVGCSTAAVHCTLRTSIPCCQEAGLQLLRLVAQRLEDVGIRYSLAAGTLLAAARDGNMQPFDTRDVDIAVPASEFQRVRTLFNDLEILRSSSLVVFTVRENNYFKKYHSIHGTPSGRFCFHPGEQNWGREYNHKFSLFSKTPYLDMYPVRDAAFEGSTHMELGTLRPHSKTWFRVNLNWESVLEETYPGWQKVPKYIIDEQKEYHGIK